MRSLRRGRKQRTAAAGLAKPGTGAAEWPTRRGVQMVVSSRGVRAVALLALLFAIATPARADRDLIGVTQATFGWTAAPGNVIAYMVYVERNYGGFIPHPTTPIKAEGDRVVTVTGSYGDMIRIQVAALESYDDPEGPRSDPSEWIRFVAPPSTTPPSNPPPTTPPTPPKNPPSTPPPVSVPPVGQPNAGTSPDFDGDGRADILLRDGSNGSIVIWIMDGDGPTASVRTGSVATNSAIVGNGDYDGDGHADLLTRHDATGSLSMQLLVGGAVVGGGQLPSPASPEWEVAASGDFNGDGRDDLLLRNTRRRQLEIWFMNGPNVLSQALLRDPFSASWQAAGAADFDGDGRADILWYHSDKKSAEVSLIDARPSIRKTVRLFNSDPGSDIVATGDADGDGLPDVVVRDRASGMLQIRFTDAAKGKPRAKVARILDSGAYLAASDGSLAGFEVQGGADYDGNDRIDLVLRNTTTGDLRVWYIENAAVVNEVRLADPGASWVFEGVGAESPATHR